MTIWLDRQTVREELIEFLDLDGEIVGVVTSGDKVSFTIQYRTSNWTLDASDLRNITQFLESIRTGDPELEISSTDQRGLQVTIRADKNVYRES